MTAARLRTWSTWLARGVCALVLTAMVLRVGFPLELEWMEGGVLHQAWRLAHGQSLYPRASAQFVPFLYTPGFPVVLCVLGQLFGFDYWLGRTVSICACVATGWAIWVAVRQAGKPSAHAWAAVGLFASGYVFTFRWLDLGRPDALMLAFLTWALVLARRGGRRSIVGAGVLISLAFWTKQTAAVFVGISGLAVLLQAHRHFARYFTIVAVLAGGGVWLGQAWTEGALWHYIYELHQTHAFNTERFTSKTWGMFAHAGPFVALAVVVCLAGRTRGSVTATADSAYWGAMAVTGLAVSALGYATQWAEPNAFIPGVALGAIAVGVMMQHHGRAEQAALALVCLQIVFSVAVEPIYQPIQDHGWTAWRHSYQWQNPARTIPSRQQREQAAQLRTEIESPAAGSLLALSRPWWSILSGGSSHAGSMGLHDVRPQDRASIQRTIAQGVRNGRWARIWLEGAPPRWLRPALRPWQWSRADGPVTCRRHGDARVRPMSGYMSDAGMVTPYRADQLMLGPPTQLCKPPAQVSTLYAKP